MKNIAKYSIFTLLLAQLFVFSACLKDEDKVTADAKTGGLVIPGSDVVPYKLGATPTLPLAVHVLGGPAVSKVEVYKKFTNSVTKKSSDKVLFTTIDVAGANKAEDVTKEFSTTYAELKNGLTVGGVALPDSEGDLNIGDFWELSFIAIMADGSKAVNGAKTIVSVANAYAGKYQAFGTFTHPTAGARTINREKTLLAISAYKCLTELGDLGGSGYDMYITVNPADNTVVVTRGVTCPTDVFMTAGKTSYYDPATKKFYLYYYYVGSGGNRVIDEVLTAK